MKVAFFSTHHFEESFYRDNAMDAGHEFVFYETSLNQKTAKLAHGFHCVCCFVHDKLDEPTLKVLAEEGVRLVALRAAGYSNVDLKAAGLYGITVVRVPAYSPHAIAEHTVGLLLSLNRKLHKAYARVRDLNFSLDGLVGFDLFGKTVGVIGTGRIGSVFATIMKGFGCQVIAFDPFPDKSLSDEKIVQYVPMMELLQKSDIISLHVPLLPITRHLIDTMAFSQMKSGVILLNTGRGALIDSVALIGALKSGHLGGAALDVYEEEEGIFYNDLSDQILKDDVLARLLTFPNVLMTSHQGFLTKEALANIAQTTLQNISAFENGSELMGQVPY